LKADVWFRLVRRVIVSPDPRHPRRFQAQTPIITLSRFIRPPLSGIDQIGSVRRVFASTTNALAYSYDPYGVPLQAAAPLTDFVYAGMFYNADSGLYLSNYRAFDPIAGRWLSRDPLGEESDPLANLYTYVGGNTLAATDTLGLGPRGTVIGAVVGGVIGAIGGGSIGVLCGPGAVGCAPFTAAEGAEVGAAFGAAAGNAVEDTLLLMAKKSQKERSTDTPSWIKGQRPRPGQSGKEFADEALDQRYGKGNYNTGPGSEHSKIKKWADRGCQ
jgi:RHS repeat-associated protein